MSIGRNWSPSWEIRSSFLTYQADLVRNFVQVNDCNGPSVYCNRNTACQWALATGLNTQLASRVWSRERVDPDNCTRILTFYSKFPFLSKATYGGFALKKSLLDEYIHSKDYTNPVSLYVGWFCIGCVIYWSGFTEECNCAELKDSGVYIVEMFSDCLVVRPGAHIASGQRVDHFSGIVRYTLVNVLLERWPSRHDALERLGCMLLCLHCEHLPWQDYSDKDKTYRFVKLKADYLLTLCIKVFRRVQ